MRNVFSDPTANTAIANIEREMRRKKRLLQAKPSFAQAGERAVDQPIRRRQTDHEQLYFKGADLPQPAGPHH